MRSLSPVRPSEEKERTVRRLKAQILPLKQQETTLPLLQHTCREIVQRIRLCNQEKASLEQQYRNRIEAAQRTVAEQKAEYERLKVHQRTLLLQMTDLQADRSQLKAHRDKCDMEMDRLRKEADSLFSNNELMIVETNKLLHAEEGSLEENHMLNSHIRLLSTQNADIQLKLADVRRAITELENDKLLFIERIKRLEQENNDMEDSIGDRETSIDMKSLEARKKDDSIRMQLDRLTELQAKAKRIKAEMAHKSGLLRAEQERNAQYHIHIKKAEKCVKDIEERTGQQNNFNRDISAQNEQAHTLNKKIVQDMELCQGHLANLLVQNETLVNELNNHAIQDDLVRKLMAARRPFKPLEEYYFKASRLTMPNN